MIIKKTLILGTLCLVASGATLFVKNRLNKNWISHVDRAVDQFAIENGPGGVVGIVMDGKLVYARAFGYADVDARRLNTTNTLFDIASCTKQFTAAAILKLNSEGRIDLGADIRGYLPALKLDRQVTVEQLLTHSSGVHDYSELMILARGRQGIRDFSTQQQLDLIYKQTSLSFEPGEDENYSNSNYVLLAELIEKVSGQSATEYISDHLFGPLEMSTARFGWTDPGDAAMASQYPARENHSGDFASVPRTGGVSGLYGAGGIVAGVGDLARWVSHFETATLGGARLDELMAVRAGLPGNAETEHGRGVVFGTTPDGHRWMEHTGRGSGGTSVITWWPDARVGFIVLTNTDELWAQSLSDQFYQLIISGGPKPKTFVDWNKKKPISVESKIAATESIPSPSQSAFSMSAEELDRFVGSYPADQPVGACKPPSGGVGVNRIERRGNELIGIGYHGHSAPLNPIGPHSLQMLVPDRSIHLQFDNMGTSAQTVQFSDPAENNGQLSEPMTRIPDPSDSVLKSFVGRYQSPDLVADIPITISNADGRLFMTWGTDTKQIEAFFMDETRLSTWTDGMQCNLVFSRGDSGGVTGFKYEGHRVWHLPFKKL